MQCHTAAAGRSLGLELGQLDGEHLYPSTNRIANQLKTLEHIGLLSSPLAAHPAYPRPRADGPLDARARAYLHANCSHCHRPEGGNRATMDLRFATSRADAKICNAPPVIEELGIQGARVVTPGHPETSILSARMHALDAKRMPPLASRRIDEEGVRLIDDWIRGLACP
jgi:mono/diheme cytochrome c family protein